MRHRNQDTIAPHAPPSWPPARHHDVTTVSPICHCYVASVSPLCHHSVATASPLCHHYVTSVLPLCHHCVTIMSPLCHHYVTTASRRPPYRFVRVMRIRASCPAGWSAPSAQFASPLCHPWGAAAAMSPLFVTTTSPLRVTGVPPLRRRRVVPAAEQVRLGGGRLPRHHLCQHQGAPELKRRDLHHVPVFDAAGEGSCCAGGE